MGKDKPSELDIWHDPWNTEARPLDEQRAMLRHSLTAAPKDDPE